MAKNANSKFTGFMLTDDVLGMLKALSESFDGNMSMTMRFLIKKAYREYRKERS